MWKIKKQSMLLKKLFVGGGSDLKMLKSFYTITTATNCAKSKNT